MGLNSDGDDGEIIWMGESQSEQASEQAREQARERASQAITDLQAHKKDEQKAKKADDVLAKILAHLLESGKSDFILIKLTPLLQARIPSHILESILALLDWQYLQWCAESIDVATPKEQPIYVPTEEIIEYSEPLPDEIHTHLNVWFGVSKEVLTKNPSWLARNTFKQKIGEDTIKQELEDIMSYVFGEFLYSHKIQISKNKASNYAAYVVQQLIKWSQ